MALLVANAVRAEQSGWRLPAAVGAAVGGLHTVYAERSDSGMADVYSGLSLLSQADLLDGNGARRMGYRLGAVFPIIDKFEAGIDIAGASITGLGGLNDSMSNFGDIRLRAKYYKRFQALGIVLAPGYNLIQGVQDQSTVADVASPYLGLGLSYFGRECKAPNPMRMHLNAAYTYDRTINFLNASRQPSRFERFAWQMRDYTYVEGRLGVEYELAKALPIIEYGIEVPANDFKASYLIHTVSPGIKFNPWDTLAVMLAADLGFGGDSSVAPAVPLYDMFITFSYRFKGTINKPASRRLIAPATEPQVQGSSPSENEQPAYEQQPAATEPSATPIAPKATTAPSDAISLDDVLSEPVLEQAPATTSSPPATVPPTKAKEPTKPVAPEPSKPATNKKPASSGGPVSLDQFEE